MSKGLKVLLIIGVIFVLILLVRDQLIKHVVVSMAKEMVGVNVTIGDLKLGLINQSLQIKDLKVYNPPAFVADKPMLDVPEVTLRLDVASFLTGTWHVRYMRFDMKEARVIRRKDGALNVSSLQSSGQASSQKKTSDDKKSSSEKQMKLHLDLLVLNIGTIYIEDYTSGKDKPKLTVANLNMHDREFKGITTVAELSGLVMFQALMPTGFGGDFLSGSTPSDIEAPLVNAIDGLFKRR